MTAVEVVYSQPRLHNSGKGKKKRVLVILETRSCHMEVRGDMDQLNQELDLVYEGSFSLVGTRETYYSNIISRRIINPLFVEQICDTPCIRVAADA